MQVNFFIFLVLSVICCINLAMILFFVAKGKRTPLFGSFLTVQLVLFLWLCGQMTEFLFPAVSDHTPFLIWMLIPFCFIGSCWFLFCISFTEFSFIPKQTFIPFIFFLSTLLYGVGITNPYHHLFYLPKDTGTWLGNYGPVFWVNSAFTYFLVLFGIVHLFLCFYKTKDSNIKKQSLLLAIGAMIPLIANVLYVFKRYTPGYDITPITFAIPLLVFAIGNYKYAFMDIIPTAFRKIIESTGEGLVVLDKGNKILYYNKTAVNFLQNKLTLAKNSPIQPPTRHEIVSKLDGAADTFLENFFRQEVRSPQKIELAVPPLILSIKLLPLFSSRGDIIGKMAVLSDISEYKKMQQELEAFAVVSGELAVERERIRFARDVHDTLGHSMTLLISLLEVAKIKSQSQPQDLQTDLSAAISVAKEGLAQLRNSVRGLKPENRADLSLPQQIQKLVDGFAAPGVRIDFTLQGNEELFSGYQMSHPSFYENCSETLFRACQESMTNSVRHGKARNISIILDISADPLRLFIIDDGQGSKAILKGFGLQSMEDRIKQTGGKIFFGSDGESGFYTRIEIPQPK